MKICSLFCLMFFCLSVSAQKGSLKQIYAMNPVVVVKPAEVDSVDRKDKKFTDESLLKLNLKIPGQLYFMKNYEADEDGFFQLETREKESYFQPSPFS